MVRCSNIMIGVLNIVTVLLSIAVIRSGTWLSHHADTTVCEKFLEKPIIVLGVFLMIVSLAGLVGACCRNACFLWIYLCVMFVLIVLLFCFTVFAFVVTHKGAGKVVSGIRFKEYHLGDYSHWLQNRVENSKNWHRIKSCLQDAELCTILEAKNYTLDQLNEHMSPMQSGCCKPLTACNFTFVSATVWNKPAGLDSSSIPDCNTWQNDSSMRCYDCQSCKDGVLANIAKDWKKVAIANIIILVFLIVVYSIGCCAFRNNRQDNAYSRAPAHP